MNHLSWHRHRTSGVFLNNFIISIRRYIYVFLDAIFRVIIQVIHHTAIPANSPPVTQADNPVAIQANSNQAAIIQHHQRQALHQRLNECSALLILIAPEKLPLKSYSRLCKMARARTSPTKVASCLSVSWGPCFCITDKIHDMNKICNDNRILAN